MTRRGWVQFVRNVYIFGSKTIAFKNRRVATLSALLAGAILLLGAACTGNIGNAAGQGGAARGSSTSGTGTLPTTPTTGAGSGGVRPPEGSACATLGVNPGRAPLRRLNHAEFRNTVRDLLGETGPIVDSFPPNEEGLGFSNNADAQFVSGLLAENYMTAAETMATHAIAKLDAIQPCDTVSKGEDACARLFVQNFGRRVFRRPLSDAEVTRFIGLYGLGRNGATYEEGISVVLQAMLQSPNFLYRVEDGVPPQPGQSVVLLTSFEMATRMSYFLWGTIPDAQLSSAADANALGTPPQLAAQAERMMKDERAKQMPGTFHREWLELTHALEAPKAPMMYPAWTPQLAADLFTESQTFVDQVFWTDGQLSSLLAAPYSFVNASVAQLYGAPAPAGTAFTKIMLDPSHRAGILTQGTFLASHANPDQTSPVRRGKFVREQLLCQPVPPPPNDIVIKVPDYDPNTSTRERFIQHETEARCASCHAVMDHIGFGFESYDAIGAYRTQDGPHPVDATGTLTLTDVDGDFDGAVALAHKLATSADVESCVVKQWFRFANGRAEVDADACSLEMIQKELVANQNDMRTLPSAIVKSDAFRYLPRTGGAP